MKRNHPRIFSTNKRMGGGVFVHLLSIRGWLWELPSSTGDVIRARRGIKWFCDDPLETCGEQEYEN